MIVFAVVSMYNVSNTLQQLRGDRHYLYNTSGIPATKGEL